jgi:short-subunit dehydrogenase
MRVDGRRVLITGASRGIGERVAHHFAQAGADVALVARTPERLAKVAADTGGRAYPADLSDPGAVDELLDRVEADGPVTILVNNAALDVAGDFTTLDPAEMRRVVQTNLVTPLELSRQLIPRLIERGGGHIVNVSSLSGTNTLPGLTVYSATKAGLSHFTGCLRAELKGRPVGTTLVEIGPTATEMWDSVLAYPTSDRAQARLRRLGLIVDLDVDQVAAAIVRAVEHNRRHVRLPRRDLAFPLLVETPRRLTEILLAGVR